MIAYFDCFAGAAGDMILGALIDAGADIDVIRKAISGLNIEAELIVEHVHRGGIKGISVQVEAPIGSSYRTAAELGRVIKKGGLEPEVRDRALRVLERLSRAEAAVHGVSPEQSRLHEVGAADTLVDLVGTSAALEDLGIQRVFCSPVATGTGTIKTEHGVLPLPAPAVVELLKKAPMYGRDLDVELVTPTGAAILAEITESFGPMPPLKVGSVGHGAGSRELDIPNLVRVIVGEETSAEPEAVEELVVEATIDDMNPEFYEYVSEKLFEAGANDVWLVPVVGKKGRPANVLSVLVPPGLESKVAEVLISETSTIGFRATPVRKWMLEREWKEVSVGGHVIRVKVARSGGKVVNLAPEYSDCADAAKASGLPLKEVFQQAVSEARRQGY